MMTEPTYSISRWESESPKQVVGFSTTPIISLNNDEMGMKWLKHELFEVNLVYRLRKHSVLGGIMLIVPL
jgi:hypothetical protein